MKITPLWKRRDLVACFVNNNRCLKPILLFISMLIWSVQVSAQNQNLAGTVKDDKGQLLSGVSVTVKGSVAGTKTDDEGKFTISAQPNDVLIFSYVGLGIQEIEIKGRATLDVVLSAEAKALTDVIVIAYGTTTKRTATGSVQTVNAKELQDIPVAQITQKLQGKLAGVQIAQTTGTPGAGMTVRIRGQASISAGNSPLYVVDGFPIVGDINNISPNEIETISVLKDAASTSLYGSRAANGVVLITTRQARSGQTNIGLNAYYGVQQVPEKGRPEMMNASEFAQFQKEFAEENGRTVDSAYQNPAQLGEGTNWYDVLLRNAPIQDVSLSLSSNSERISTAATLSFFNQDGVMLNSNYKRYAGRLNSEFRATEKLKIGFNIAPTYSIANSPQSDGTWWQVPSIIQGAILTTPLAPYKNADGSIPLTATGPGLFGNPNWYNVLQVVKNETKTTRLLSNAFLQYNILKNLTFKSSVNVDLGQSLFNNFTPSTAGSLFNPPPRIPTAVQRNSQYYTWLWENTIGYRKSIGDHNFDLLAGYTVQEFKGDYSNTNATNFPDDQVQTLNAATSTLTTSDIQEWSLVSYISRLNYNYRGKYLLSGSLRRDGSSRFGSNNRWGNFPSISAGWVISDEPFMPLQKHISFLKLRASYGLIGNNNIGNYTHYASVTNTNYVFNSVIASGRSATTLGNTDLGWEQTKQLDIGLDLGLLNDRILLSYDFYKKTTDGLLYQVDVPYASGYPNYITNVGKFEFWGHEFTISSKNIVGDFKWNTDFNIAFNDNKVISLGTEDAPIYGDFSITQVGERIGQFYGMVMEGVYKDQADFDKSPKEISSVVGSAKMKDVNGDGKITTSDDRDVIGNPVPKFIYGITNSFAYKNFDLTIVAAGSYGNKIYNQFQEFTTNLDGVFNVLKEVNDRWKSPQDPGNGRYGTTKAGATGLNRTFNTSHLYTGSFFTIKNITLGYNFALANNRIFKGLRLYGSIQQALVITNYPGINPETSTARNGTEASALNLGIDNATYPVPRTFSLGFNVNFR
jgi:TonB-linked SusC/RagA family outer membrane protein